MILSSLQFGQLWRDYFESFCPNQNLHILYTSYLVRENALQDYLDIFRGVDTRQFRGQNNPNIGQNNPHRFQNILNNGYQVNYLLIAEAPPVGVNYIYQNAMGAYITAALNAFHVQGVGQLNATQRLEQLANWGILILDLFPFNLDYNVLVNGLSRRDILIAKHFTSDFFINTKVDYSIINRVNSYRCEINNFLNINNVTNTAFIAPPKINHYFGSLNCSGFFDLSSSPIKIQKGLNSFNHHVNVDNINARYSWAPINPNMDIVNSYLNAYNIPTLSTSPFYTCCCNAGNGNPNDILIRNALNL